MSELLGKLTEFLGPTGASTLGHASIVLAILIVGLFMKRNWNVRASRYFVILIVTIVTGIGFTSSAAAASRIFNLYLKNADANKTVTFTISTEGSRCWEGTPRRGVIGRPVRPGGTVTVKIARVQGHGCDGEQGRFAIDIQGGAGDGQSVHFNFSNDGGLAVTDYPNAYEGILSSKNPNDESYTWETLPLQEVTASKGVGSWERICQNICNRTLKTEITNTTTRTEENSEETTKALSVSLEAGIEFGSASAKTSVTASEERSVGRTLSQELSSGTTEGDEQKVEFSSEEMIKNNVFAVWRWVVTSQLSNGKTVALKTVMFSCTPDAQPPSYLPGSREDRISCRQSAQVAQQRAAEQQAAQQRAAEQQAAQQRAAEQQAAQQRAAEQQAAQQRAAEQHAAQQRAAEQQAAQQRAAEQQAAQQRAAEQQAAQQRMASAAATPAFYHQLFFPGDQVNSYFVTTEWHVVMYTPQGESTSLGNVYQSEDPNFSMQIQWSHDGSTSGVDTQGAIWSWDASGTPSHIGDSRPYSGQ